MVDVAFLQPEFPDWRRLDSIKLLKASDKTQVKPQIVSAPSMQRA